MTLKPSTPSWTKSTPSPRQRWDSDCVCNLLLFTVQPLFKLQRSQTTTKRNTGKEQTVQQLIKSHLRMSVLHRRFDKTKNLVCQIKYSYIKAPKCSNSAKWQKCKKKKSKLNPYAPNSMQKTVDFNIVWPSKGKCTLENLVIVIMSQL